MHGRSLPAILSGVALLSLGLGFGTEQARAEPLSSLIANNGSIKVGDLVFDQFSYTLTGQMPSAANVNVNPFIDALGNAGIRLTGGFTDAFDSPSPQQASDATLSYRVTSLGAPLSDIHLFGNPQIVGPGDGLMSVVETVQPSNQPPIQIEIHDSVNNGVSSQKLQDMATFAPLPSLQVVSKDILALNLGGFPTASIIDQTFSTNIPEPTSALVLGLGAFAAVVHGWRRSRSRSVGSGSAVAPSA